MVGGRGLLETCSSSVGAWQNEAIQIRRVVQPVSQAGTIADRDEIGRF